MSDEHTKELDQEPMGIPERIYVPISCAQLIAVSPELQNIEGAWYVLESSRAAPQGDADDYRPPVAAEEIAEDLKPYFTNDMGAAERAGIKPATVFIIADIISRHFSVQPVEEQKLAQGFTVDYRKPHVFDPIGNDVDECECGLVKDAELHSG